MDCYQNVMSDNYERCRELLRTLEIPTRSEAIDLLGDPLAGVIFQECKPREIREAFGLEPPLEGPGPELWVSPSDLLIGKVVLKPPLTQKYIQALTHQGIMKIGAVIEEKFFNKLEKDKQDCLENQDRFLRRAFALKLAHEIEKTKLEEHHKCEELLDTLTKYYEEYIMDLIDHMDEKLNTLMGEYEEANAEQIETFENNLKTETERITRELTEEFLNKLQEQETILVRIFTRQLEENEAKHKCAMEFERTKCKENLIQLKHSLECKNISNLMYVLCRERRKCKTEKIAIEQEYEMKIDELTENVGEKAKEIEELRNVRVRKTREVDARERCLVEILRQYQKFINYALRAAPTQAEFLLNIDRMMTFEIDDYCVEHGGKAGSEAEYEEEEGEEKEEEEEQEASEIVLKDRKAEVEVGGSEIKSPRSSRQGLREPSDVLPAVYLNDKLYVREDFRDRFTNVIEINPSHELWNEDVEDLMKILRESVRKEQDGDSRMNRTISVSYFSSVHFNKNAPAPLQSEAPIEVVEVPIPVEEEIIEEIEILDDEKSLKAGQEETHSHQGILKSEHTISSRVSSPSASRRSIAISEEETEYQTTRVSSTSTLKHSIPSNTSADSGDFKNKARSLLAVTDSLDKVRDKKSLTALPKSGAARRKSSLSTTFTTTPTPGKRASVTSSSFVLDEDMSDEKRPAQSATMVGARDSLEFQHESVRRQSQVIVDTQKEITTEPDEATLLPISESQSESKLLEVHDSLEKIRTCIHHSTITMHVDTDIEESNAKGKLFPETGRKSMVAFIPKVAEMKPESKDHLLGHVRKASQTRAIPRQGPEFDAVKCQQCKIVGDPDAREGFQDAHEFTSHRVHEFVNLIKENPSLIRLFTS